MIFHAYPRLNKALPVATLYPSFLDGENPEPVPSILQVDKEKPAASSPKMTSGEDRREKEAPSDQERRSGGGVKGRPQRDHRAAGTGLEMKEEGEYKESEGQAEVRGSGRVAQEAGEPSQTRGRPPLEQNIGSSRKEPQKKSQEGSSSSSTATRRDPEDEQCSADTNEQKRKETAKNLPLAGTQGKGEG